MITAVESALLHALSALICLCIDQCAAETITYDYVTVEKCYFQSQSNKEFCIALGRYEKYLYDFTSFNRICAADGERRLVFKSKLAADEPKEKKTDYANEDICYGSAIQVAKNGRPTTMKCQFDPLQGGDVPMCVERGHYVLREGKYAVCECVDPPASGKKVPVCTASIKTETEFKSKAQFKAAEEASSQCYGSAQDIRSIRKCKFPYPTKALRGQFFCVPPSHYHTKSVNGVDAHYVCKCGKGTSQSGREMDGCQGNIRSDQEFTSKQLYKEATTDMTHCYGL